MFMIEPFLVTPAATLTRASTATYQDGAGVLRYAVVNEPRPIIETNAATNLVPSSQVFAAGANVTVASSASPLAPDNLTNCTVISGNATNGVHSTIGSKTANLTPGGSCGASIFVRKDNSANNIKRCVVQVVYGDANALVGKVLIDLAAGVVRSQSGLVSSTVETCTNNWYRVKLQFVSNSSTGGVNPMQHALAVLLDNATGSAAESTSFASNTGDKIYVFGSQIELGSVSSYIPTAGGTVTRAADVLPTAVAGVSSLVSTNVPIDDHPVWAIGTAYAIGAKVIVTGDTNIWEALAASTGVLPTTDTTGKWQNIGKVNAWKMFDSYMSTATSKLSEINVNIRPAYPVDSVVLMGVSANQVRVIVDDSVDGTIADRTVITRTHVAESSFYGYFFGTQIDTDIVIITGLPKSRTCTLSIQISAPNSTAQCTMCLVGAKDDFGDLQWGFSFGINDYSVKTPNAFGDYVITERAYADRADYAISVATGANMRIKKRLSAVRAKACVYVGSVDFIETVTYGYFKSFSQVLRYLTHSECNVEVDSLAKS